jgi:hypothetical protein
VDQPFFMRSDFPTWKRLINNTLAVHENISLITMIFSDRNQVRMVGNLSGDNAQAFVDKIDKASSHKTSFKGKVY